MPPPSILVSALLASATLLAQSKVLPPQGHPPSIVNDSGGHGLAPKRDGTPLEGSVAGSERWIVQFGARQNLSPLREAIQAGHSAADIEPLLTDAQAWMQNQQAPFVAAVERLGGRVLQQWWIINAAAVEVTPAQLEAIRGIGAVRLVEPDEAVEPTMYTETNSRNHNADLLQRYGHDGSGVAIAIIDSGFDTNMGGTGRPHAALFPDGNPTVTTGSGIGGSRIHSFQVGPLAPDVAPLHGTVMASLAAGAEWSSGLVDDGHAPGADIVAYSCALNTLGTMSQATVTTAAQQVAADRAQFNIVATVMAFQGSPDPVHATNQAFDVLARDFHVFHAYGAGNTGPDTSSSIGATNGVSVGAVTADTHQVWANSAVGPLFGSVAPNLGQRDFPTMVACGVNVDAAQPDNETVGISVVGTSVACPQVVGAAAQLRARFPGLSALDTKAVLLAGAADVSLANPGLDRNSFGVGMLKNDRSHHLVACDNLYRDAVSPGNVVHRFLIPVVSGHRYQAALAWHRSNERAAGWTDLDLRVLDATGSLVASSVSYQNLHETVRWTASYTGFVVARIAAFSLPPSAVSIPYTVAWSDLDQPLRDVVEIGDGCPGSAAGYDACAEINPGLPALITPSISLTISSQETAFFVPSIGTTTIRGIDLMAQTRGANIEQVTVRIYQAQLTSAGSYEPGFPAGSPTTMFVGSSPAFGRALFASPVNVPSNYFVSVRSQSSLVDIDVDGASPVPAFIQSGPGTWSTGFTLKPSLRVLCDGTGSGAVPHARVRSRNVTALQFGNTTQLTLSESLPNTFAFCAIGSSENNLSLAFVGAPCTLRTSADSLSLIAVDGDGWGELPIALPSRASFLGSKFYAQFGVLDPAANAAGLVLSNGLRMSVGN